MGCDFTIFIEDRMPFERPETISSKTNPWLGVATSDFLHRLTKVIQQNGPNYAFVDEQACAYPVSDPGWCEEN